MDAAKQRIRAAATRKKEEVKLAKGTSSTPKAISKVSKRKPGGDDDRPSTHKDYVVREVGSFVKPTNIGPCDLLGMEDLGESALFDLTRVCLLSQVKLVLFLSDLFD